MKKKFVSVLVTLGLVMILAVPASAIEKERLLEVKAKLEEAAKYLSEKKEAALPEFNDKNGQWLQKAYITVVGLNGLFLSHPNPVMVGKNLLHLADGKGKNLYSKQPTLPAPKAEDGWNTGGTSPVRKNRVTRYLLSSKCRIPTGS